MLKKIVSAAAVASLLMVPLTGNATTVVNPLYVAGGTLAAFPYYDLANASLFPNSADTGATCTAKTEDCAVEMLYAAVGTGSAQLSFLDHNGQGSVGSGEPADTDGVTFPSTTYPYPDLDFAAGDAPLSTSQLSSYDSTLNGSGTDLARWGSPTVVPLMSAPIAIAYNATGTGLPSGTNLQLSIKSLCGIFTGTIVNWDDPSLATDNPGVTFNNLAITPVVRSDGSGTTFIFSQALSQYCSTFTAVTGGVGIGGSTTTAPVWPNVGTTTIAEHGSGALQAEVNAVGGSIGYISSNYVQPFAPTGPLAASVANKAGHFEQPTVAAAKLGLAGPYSKKAPTGTAGGVTTAYPVPVTNQILYMGEPSNAGAYPLVGFTYGYFYQCSQSANITAALTGTHGYISKYILKGEVGSALTPADSIIESQGLVELTNGIKSNTVKLLTTSANKIVTGPVSGVCTL